MDSRYVVNPLRQWGRAEPRTNFARAFHERLPDYSPTPLLDAAGLAAHVGVGRLWLKDESARFGLPSFELLGAAWAIYRGALERLGRRTRRWTELADLRPQLQDIRPLRVVTVSDNNFGLAVTRGARLLGFEVRVFVPGTIDPARQIALEREGAEVVVVGASYDDALAEASVTTGPDDLVVSDTSWEGYEDVPRWVAEGYVTLFEEVSEELEARGAGALDAVVVPMGTGALAVAAATWLRTVRYRGDLLLLGVEAERAACFGESVEAGKRLSTPAPAPSALTSLARGLPSPAALPVVAEAFDGFVAISDEQALAAVGLLARHGVQASPSGAAALAGLLEARSGAPGVSLDAGSRVLVVCAEGPLRAR